MLQSNEPSSTGFSPSALNWCSAQLKNIKPNRASWPAPVAVNNEDHGLAHVCEEGFVCISVGKRTPGAGTMEPVLTEAENDVASQQQYS